METASRSGTIVAAIVRQGMRHDISPTPLGLLPAVQEEAFMTIDRTEELEVRVAHLEKTLSDLNDVITQQWKQIDKLERQMQRIGEELAEVNAGEAPAATQKPPHY
jgi:SlyX protein